MAIRATNDSERQGPDRFCKTPFRSHPIFGSRPFAPHRVNMAGRGFAGVDPRSVVARFNRRGEVDCLGSRCPFGATDDGHLAMMLHELGTNSVKYGALSAAEGWVTVSWSVAGDVLNLQWVERGEPTVLHPRNSVSAPHSSNRARRARVAPQSDCSSREALLGRFR